MSATRSSTLIYARLLPFARPLDRFEVVAVGRGMLLLIVLRLSAEL